MLKLSLIILVLGLVQQALVAPTIDHNISQKLRQGQRINVLISFQQSTDSILAKLKFQTFASREDRLNTVAQSLKNFASNSQKNVITLLLQEQPKNPFSFTVLWISNQLAIHNVNLDLLQKLLIIPEISLIQEEKFIQLEEPLDLEVFELQNTFPNSDEVQWGVEQIEAPAVWKRGNTGQEVVIATIDTGVRVSHETLRDNFVGDYGWFDPYEKSRLPNDVHGHGTHVTANIAGNFRNVGVAPGSKWASCRGCGVGACSVIALLACGQWVTCPTKTDGSDPDCSKAPHLVSNSWGGGSESPWFSSTVGAWHAAGIIPVFSIGNDGPLCGSTNSPGDYDNVIGVGATTIDNELSYFSSVGPTPQGQRMKPDVAAPGSNVFSAYHTSDTAYASMSGTSMACPHAAGVVALLLKENSKINYDQVVASLKAGGVRITSANKTCGGVPDSEYPNFHVGSGRISAVKTISAMHRIMSK